MNALKMYIIILLFYQFINHSNEFIYSYADKGQPGVDYPMLTTIPPTKFNCKEHKDGYYGDAETNCQV